MQLVPAKSRSRAPWPALACALAGGAVFQFFGNATRGYIDTTSAFYWWGFQWFNPRSEAGHGPLILGIAAWLLWRNLKNAGCQLPNAECKSENSAFGIWRLAFGAMAAGLALHAVGFAAQQTRVSILALLVFAWGVLRLGGGRKWGGAAVFPLGFLAFAIPVGAIDEVGLPLRLRVVEAGEWLSRLAGIPVVRNGTQLLAPDGRFNYDVAAPCSGVNSLVALAALSLLIGYLNFRGGWRRLLVLLPCLPLVYVGNVARITSIVFAAQWGGPKWGELAHTVMGYGVFVIVLGGVLLASTAIRRWWPERSGDGEQETGDREPKSEVRPRSTEGSGLWSLVLGPPAVAAVVVALAAGEMFFLKKLAALPPRGAAGVLLAADEKDPVELPAFLGTEWIGRRTAVSDVERQILPADTGFSRRHYVSVANPARAVYVSVVLSGRDRSSIHRPELCLVGQGWTVGRATQRRFEFPGRPEAAFPATVLNVRREIATPAPAGKPRVREIVPQLVAYWFVGSDTVVATHWQRLARDAWSRVVHARADRWAYVLLQTDATDGEAAALARMEAVLKETLPAFQRPIPAR
jgi:EpsI family protein